MAGDESGFKLASAWVEVKPDLTGFADEAKAKIDAATRDLGATAKLTADDSDLTAKVASAKGEVSDFGSKTGTARLGADSSGVDEGVASADAKVDEFGSRSVKAKAGLDSGELDAEVAKDDAELDRIDGRTVTAHAKLDSSGFNLGSLFSGGLTGPAGITGGILGGGALLPALPGALAGGTAAAGTLGLAIAGVSKALTDYQSKQNSAATATGQSAASQVSAAHTIATAQQAVSAAETQQAHDAITSAESIKVAQQGVATATQQAAQSQISAEQQLANAQYSEQQAQESLTQARQQAILTIQQLENASADAALNVQQDRLNLQQAQQTQAQVDANSKSTSLQRAQAALAVKEAEQQLKEAIQNRTNSAKAAQTADKQGVAGNPSVLAAQHALRQAHQGVADAQRNLTQTEVQGAQAIANAQRALADAQRNASWTQQADSQRVSQAQQGLAYAYASAGAAAGKTSAATNQYAKDMAALTPAGRQFVNSITGMMGALHSLEGVAQKALLPGLTSMLRGVKSIMPLISGEVGKMGGILSKGFSAVGKALESSGFQHTLKSLFTEGNRFFTILGPAIGKMAGAFLKMGAESGPAVTGLAKGLAAIANGFGHLFTNLGKYSGAAGSILDTLGKAVGALGGPLGTVIGVLLSALAPLLKGALPLFRTLVDQIGRIVKAAQPGLVGIGQALGQMLTALVPVLPSLGTLVVQMIRLVDAALLPLLPLLPQLIPPMVQITAAGLKPMSALLVAVTPLISGLASILAVLLSAGLVPLVGGLADAVSAIGDIEAAGITWITNLSNIQGALDTFRHWVASEWDHLLSDATTFWTKALPDTVQNGVKSAVNWVEGKLDTFRHTVASKWDNFWSDEKSFWTQKFPQTIENAVKGAETWVIGHLDSLRHGIAAKWDAIVSYAKTKWNELEGITQTPIKWIISNVYDKLIVRFWNDIAGPVGLPKLAKLSTGARIPGYGGGDQHPALLEGGETVVSKEDSRKPFMVAAFQAAGVPGYAAGGVVTDTGGKVSSVWDGLIGGLGETFHKVIGSIEHDLREGLALPMKAAGKVISAAASHIPGTAGIAQAMKKAPGTLWAGVTKFVEGTTAGSGGGAKYTGHYGAGVTQWASDIAKVLAMLGEPASDLSAVEYRMNVESGGNPNAINLTDSNAAAGDPSRGLMQTIMTTFKAYAGPYASRSIYDPLANIYAGINYAKHAYAGRSLKSVMLQPGGYDSGGWLQPGGTNQTGRPEAVLTPAESAAFVALVKQLVGSGQQSGMRPGGGAPISVNYFGTQHPTPEQEQALLLKLGSLIGVA